MGAPSPRRRELATPEGPARVELRRPAGSPRGALLLGHGAGGGTGAPDLQAAADAATGQGWAVGLVEQPYRVAGRRAPPPARRLDTAWIAIAAQLVSDELRGLPLICGGRSSGARVACRTAQQTGAVAVLCLAFPLQPPGRPGGQPPPSRLPELEAAGVPVLVLQGERDAFGMPSEAPGRDVVVLAGDHALRSDPGGLALALEVWLAGRSAAAS
jgi:uncharacterized protein